MKPKRKIISLTLLLLTALLYIVSLLSSFSGYFSPAQGAAWMLLGLATPAVLALDAVVLAAWLAARRWLAALLPLAALIANAGYIRAMVRLPRSSPLVVQPELRVATLNCYGFNLRGDVAATARDVARIAERERVDILCLQEFGESPDFPADSTAALLARSGLAYWVREGESAVASRYPIAERQHFLFPGSENGGLRADIRIGQHTLRIYSVHLQTSGLHRLRREHLAAHGGRPPLSEAVGVLTRNGALRAGQADWLRAQIDRSPYPVVVAGDFNETPASYVYRQLQQGLVDGFREAGSGYAGTFEQLGVSLRIDFILYDRAMEATSYRTLRDRVSDHRMVVTALRRHPARGQDTR